MNLLQAVLPPGDHLDRDMEDDNLEAEFKQILFIIKPYVDGINNHHYIKMYGMWLKKLSEIHDDKKQRNKYLLELANQIHDGSLKHPFTKEPPSGPLPPLKKYTMPVLNDQDLNPYWPSVEPAKNFSSPQQYKEILRRRLKRMKPLHKLGQTKKEESSDRSPVTSQASSKTSWQDLSDGATSCAGDGELDDRYDEDFENNDAEDARSCMTNTTELSRKYSELHQNEGMRLARIYAKKFKQPGVVPEESSNMTLTETNREMDMLKTRMTDLVEVKTALRDSLMLNEERKRTISILKKKLDESNENNKELREVVELMTKKSVEMELGKNKADNALRESFNKMRVKELEALKQKHDDAIKAIQIEHKNELEKIKAEFCKKISEMEQTRRDEVRGLMVSHEMQMKEKNEELEREKRRNAGGEHDGRQFDEKVDSGKEEQIVHLKKCISKMDKLLLKSEKDYLKKIEKLKQELELKDLTMNMKLQGQKADLLLKNQSHKQDEVRAAIECLEEKYRKILESQKAQAQENDDKHQRIIGELKQLLNKFEIPFPC